MMNEYFAIDYSTALLPPSVHLYRFLLLWNWSRAVVCPDSVWFKMVYKKTQYTVGPSV